VTKPKKHGSDLPEPDEALAKFFAEVMADIEQTHQQLAEHMADSEQSLAEFQAEVLAQGQKDLARLMEMLQADSPN